MSSACRSKLRHVSAAARQFWIFDLTLQTKAEVNDAPELPLPSLNSCCPRISTASACHWVWKTRKRLDSSSLSMSWLSVGWAMSWGGLKIHPNQTFLMFLMCPFSNDLLTYVPAQWKLQTDHDANANGITKWIWIQKWKVQKHRGRVPRLLLQAASTQISNKKMHVAYEVRFETFFQCQFHLLHPQQALCKIELWSQGTLSHELSDSALTSLRPQQSKPARSCMKLLVIGEKSAATVRPTRSDQKILKYQHLMATYGALA